MYTTVPHYTQFTSELNKWIIRFSANCRKTNGSFETGLCTILILELFWRLFGLLKIIRPTVTVIVNLKTMIYCFLLNKLWINCNIPYGYCKSCKFGKSYFREPRSGDQVVTNSLSWTDSGIFSLSIILFVSYEERENMILAKMCLSAEYKNIRVFCFAYISGLTIIYICVNM